MVSHDSLIVDAGAAAPDLIAHILRENGLVLIKNALDPELVDYCSTAMRENCHQLRTMLDKDVNFLPACFTDRRLGERPIPLSMGKNSEEFNDPISFAGMDRTWYYEGNRQFKDWYWRHGAEFPNTLLAGLLRSVVPVVFGDYFGGSVHHSI